MNDAVLSRADELNNLAARYYMQGNAQAARLHALAALHVEPNHANALQNLSAALFQMEGYASAVSVARRALMYCSEQQRPYNKMNLGASLLGLRRYAEAQRILREALRDMPNDGNAHSNLGLCLYQTGHLNDAFAELSRAMELMPDAPNVQSDRGLTLLALGEIQRGLEAYEVRWKILHRSRIWDLGILEWKGEALRDKRILVHHEQGFGDTLMLCRWLGALRERGAELTLAVPKPLVRLLKQSFDFVTVKDWDDESIGVEFDFHTPLLSTMRWLGIELGSDFRTTPYLKSANVDMAFPLPEAPFRVGLAWSSGDHGPMLRRRRRVVGLDLLLPLTEFDGVRVISLQKDSQDIVNIGAEGIIYDPMGRVEDFADTAVVIDKLDMVIGVDSAVIHLAAAMGKPTVMLGPYTRCWRWWSPNTGEPWYKGMKHLRQSANGTWNTATASLAQIVRDAAVRKQHQLKLGVRSDGNDQ